MYPRHLMEFIWVHKNKRHSMKVHLNWWKCFFVVVHRSSYETRILRHFFLLFFLTNTLTDISRSLSFSPLLQHSSVSFIFLIIKTNFTWKCTISMKSIHKLPPKRKKKKTNEISAISSSLQQNAHAHFFFFISLH